MLNYEYENIVEIFELVKDGDKLYPKNKEKGNTPFFSNSHKSYFVRGEENKNYSAHKIIWGLLNKQKPPRQLKNITYNDMVYVDNNVYDDEEVKTVSKPKPKAKTELKDISTYSDIPLYVNINNI